MQSYIVLLLMPSLIYAIFNKEWLYGCMYMGIISVVLHSLVLVHNLEISPSKSNHLTHSNEHVNKTTKQSKFYSIWTSLKNRVLIVPGKTVSSWFDHIPNDLPFLKWKRISICTKIHWEKIISIMHKNYIHNVSRSC